MGYRLIGFLAFIFIGMTLLNRILEGAFITSSDVTILQTLTLVKTEKILGLFSLPVINLDFFKVGIPRLVKWDYSFFGGNAGIIQYFLYSFTAALSFLLFTILIGVLFQFFSRR